MNAKTENLFKGIKKNVVVLSAASLFTDISSEMLYPIIPIFLTSVLGAPMSVLGLIEGIAESTASILKAFSGWLSDRIAKRQPFVVAGYSLSALSKLIFFAAYTWPVVLAARFLDRFGKGIRTSPRDAMIADITDSEYRGKAFGFHRAMDTIGACLGPLCAIWFLSVFKDNLRDVFLVAFIPGLAAVFVLVFFLKESVVPPGIAAGGIKNLLLIRNFSPEFKKFLLASAIFAVGNSSDAFLIMRSKDLGLSVIMVILAYVLYNISYSLFSMPFGILSDRIPRKRIMAGGYMIFAVVYLGFGLASGPGIVWLLFPVYGFYIAMTDGVGKAIVADMVGKDRMGTAMGLYHFVLGIFAFFASLMAGLLWTYAGVAAPFIYGAVCAAISCAAFIFLLK